MWMYLMNRDHSSPPPSYPLPPIGSAMFLLGFAFMFPKEYLMVSLSWRPARQRSLRWK